MHAWGLGHLRRSAGHVVNVALYVFTHKEPSSEHIFAGIDVSSSNKSQAKSIALRSEDVKILQQSDQLTHPDSRIILDSLAHDSELLEKYADSLQGLSPADLAHYGRYFWEVILYDEWFFWQSTPDRTIPYGGRYKVLWINDDLKEAVNKGFAYIRGQAAWEQKGVAVGTNARTTSNDLYRRAF